MNNKTIKKFDFTIKLRGDNVYDLYFDEKWICSCGSVAKVLETQKAIIEDTLSKIQKEKEGWWKLI